MSLKILNSIVNSLRLNFRTRQIQSGLHNVQSLAAMEADSTEVVDNEVVYTKNATRYKKRFNKRQWEDGGRRDEEDGETKEKKSCEQATERIKRKKMAMLLGYCGVDYYGMQRNPGVRTIEEDLLKALWEANYITEDDFNNQQNAQFQRSSRTDKGVSAARQVVSLKMPLDFDIDEINKRLPDCIKVFAIKRVTNKFNSKIKCNARTYSYTLPTYVFDADLITDNDRKAYRISEEKLQEVNDTLAMYKGTKCYHNFTEKKYYHDPSAFRYMMHFGVEKVFVERDMEFAVLLVKGQSFMLHQIRKMVGLMLGVVRGYTDKVIMERAFSKEKVMIPTAPGLGLVLDMVHYDRYDAKFKESHDSLTWEAEEEMIEKFKHEHIYPNIVKGEIEDNSMAIWVEKLALHSYEPADDLPKEECTDSNVKESESDLDSKDEVTVLSLEQTDIVENLEPARDVN